MFETPTFKLCFSVSPSASGKVENMTNAKKVSDFEALLVNHDSKTLAFFLTVIIGVLTGY